MFYNLCLLAGILIVLIVLTVVFIVYWLVRVWRWNQDLQKYGVLAVKEIVKAPTPHDARQLEDQSTSEKVIPKKVKLDKLHENVPGRKYNEILRRSVREKYSTPMYKEANKLRKELEKKRQKTS